MVFFATVGLTACNDDEIIDGDWPPMEWKTDVKMDQWLTVTVPAEGGTYRFTCTNYRDFWLSDITEDGIIVWPGFYFTNGSEWSDFDWHNVTREWNSVKVSGSVMTVVVASNETDTPRSLKVVVTAGDIFNTFSFNQAGR